MRPETQAFIATQQWRDEPIAAFVAAWIDHPEPHPCELATCIVCGAVWEPKPTPKAERGVTSAFCSRECRLAHYAERRDDHRS